jgi:hypothetical protein
LNGFAQVFTHFDGRRHGDSSAPGTDDNPSPGTSTLVMAAQRWCRIVIVGDGHDHEVGVLEGGGEPGIDTVEKIARLALETRRHGRELVLLDVAPALRELIELCGLFVEMRG